jgi:mRNA interferase RelE/StbE
MEVVIAKSFLKDLKTKPRHVISAVEKLIDLLEGSQSLEKAKVDYKKMEGQKKGENYYRIRLGIWRIGIEYIHPKIIVLRVLARGEVYKHFPPQ